MCSQKECPTKFETRWLQEIPFSKELTDNYCALGLLFESKICNNKINKIIILKLGALDEWHPECHNGTLERMPRWAWHCVYMVCHVMCNIINVTTSFTHLATCSASYRHILVHPRIALSSSKIRGVMSTFFFLGVHIIFLFFNATGLLKNL